jgi:hypothetical protein
MAIPSARELAETAYAAYGESTGHKNYQGLPMPDWDELTDRIRLAWIEAASAVCMATMRGLTGVTPAAGPDVGDVVLVLMDPAENNGARTAPAIVTRVWSSTTINVHVLADGEATPWLTSLVYADSFDDTEGTPAVWTWPGSES